MFPPGCGMFLRRGNHSVESSHPVHGGSPVGYGRVLFSALTLGMDLLKGEGSSARVVFSN